MPALDLPLGLGTSGNDDHDECADTVERALDVGYRHVDTAQMYGNEAAVGDGIRRSGVDREEVVVATKIHPDNLAYQDAIETAHESLDRLGLDRVDLLYVHWPTSAYDPEGTLAAVDELRDEGVTDHVGLSNFTPELLDEARGLLDAPIVAHQVECHPLHQQDELRAYARQHDHNLVCYSPLGKTEIFDHDVVESVAEEQGVTPAQVCLAWELARGVVPIPKGTGDHVEENFAALDVDLPESALERIDGIATEERLIDPDEAAWNRE